MYSKQEVWGFYDLKDDECLRESFCKWLFFCRFFEPVVSSGPSDAGEFCAVARIGAKMKSISRLLILTGVGILFLICIITGVVYFKRQSVNRESSDTIKREMQEYLAEYVNELNPQFLEKSENWEYVDQAAAEILAALGSRLQMDDLTIEELLQYLTEEQITAILELITNHYGKEIVEGYLPKKGVDYFTQQELDEITSKIIGFLEEGLLRRIEDTRAADKEELLRLLEQIQRNGDKNNTALKEMIEKLRAENQKQLEENKNMTLTNQKSIGNVKKSISVLEALLNEQIIKVEGKIGVNGQSIIDLRNQIHELQEALQALKEESEHKNNEQMKTIEKEIQDIRGRTDALTLKINQLNVSVEANSEADRLRYEELSKIISELTERVNACFQSVSNGKALVASTITDKGVPTSPDADFEVISDHIKELYAVAFAAGAESSLENAAISYIRHYHTGDAAAGGGCFTKEQKHKHQSSCHKITTHNVETIIENSWGAGDDAPGCAEHGGKGNNGDFRYVDRWTCSDGTSGVKEWKDTHWFCPQCDMKMSNTYTDTVKVCKLEAGQVTGYEAACGYMDGQILQAVITFE